MKKQDMFELIEYRLKKKLDTLSSATYRDGGLPTFLGWKGDTSIEKDNEKLKKLLKFY